MIPYVNVSGRPVLIEGIDMHSRQRDRGSSPQVRTLPLSRYESPSPECLTVAQGYLGCDELPVDADDEEYTPYLLALQ